jgi:hypothetical protein
MDGVDAILCWMLIPKPRLCALVVARDLIMLPRHPAPNLWPEFLCICLYKIGEIYCFPPDGIICFIQIHGRFYQRFVAIETSFLINFRGRKMVHYKFSILSSNERWLIFFFCFHHCTFQMEWNAGKNEEFEIIHPPRNSRRTAQMDLHAPFCIY